MTDYDAIPYSDLMDLFYVWLRRSLVGASASFDFMFRRRQCRQNGITIRPMASLSMTSPGTAETNNDPATLMKMECFRRFEPRWHALTDVGRLVVVFVHKQPEAWETLVAALIRAGFVVDASWPIQTENATRSRAQSFCMRSLRLSGWYVENDQSQRNRVGTTM